MSFLPKNEKDNSIATLTNLLGLLKLRVTGSAIRDTLLSNPSYPSLLAISESLEKWKIDSAAYQVGNDKLSALPVPFVAHLKNSGGSFAAVEAVTEDSVTYLKDNGTALRVSQPEFLNAWSGNVLLTEALPGSGQRDYEKERNRELFSSLPFPALVIFLVVIGVIQFSNSYNNVTGTDLTYYLLLWVLKGIGLITAGLLLWYEYDNNNSYLNKICSVGKKTNCNAILSSKASKIFGFSWSEVGFFYFAGSFLYLCFGNYSPLAACPLILLNIIALPYIFFSVYYQAVVAKQWCVLCLTVQFVLFAEFLSALLTHQLTAGLFDQLQHIAWLQVVVAFLLPFILWLVIKPFLYDARENQKYKYDFRRFKNNAEVFNSLLQRQITMLHNPAGLGITLGNEDAENTLVKVCNPYCGPCAKSFPLLEDLYKAEGNKWKVQIIFTANPDENDYRALPVAHFLSMRDKLNSSDGIHQVLGDWYNAEDKDFNTFIEKYPLVETFEQQKPQIAAMHTWVNTEVIQFTPTYYVNGKRMPDNYDLEDLKNIF